MIKAINKSLLLKPALISLILMAPSGAIASDIQSEVENQTTLDTTEVDSVTTPFAEGSASTLVDITELNADVVSLDTSESDSLGQVTSVSQLSDVRPTDWAFQALQSLVERYGCIAGYPNGTFRGNRSATRYEMAAALNACLDQISDRFASKADLDQVKALQDEFAAELATLRGRVDGLESRVATVEAQQFSTTTKLKGEAIFGAGFVFDEDNALDSVLGVNTDGGNVGEDRVFLANRVRLNLDTSFNGKDRLRTRLQASNIPNLSGGGTAGVEAARLGFDGNNTGNTVELDELNYKFEPIDNLAIKIAVIGGDYKDDVETFNPYLKSSGSGALSRFFRVNPVVHRAPGDTTLSAVYNFNDNLELAVMFAADDADQATAGAFNTGGLCCGGEFGILAQIGYSPFKDVRLGLSYARSEYKGTTTDITRGTADSPATGVLIGLASSDTSEPFGNVDTTTDNFGFNIDAKITKGIHFSGWTGLTLARSRDVMLAAGQKSQVGLINWAANLIFPDLLAEGNRGSISVGMPPFIFDSGDLNIDDGTAPTILVEAQYLVKLSKNINLTPGVMVIFNANSTSSNDPIFVPVIRTTFKF